MGVTTIISGIFAIAKAIPAVRDIFNQVQGMILKWELSKIEDKYTAREQMIDTLVDSISKADTREKRRDLSKILHKYTTGDFSNRMSK